MKVAIVTGGSNGIGRSTALELGKHGVGVILTYNNNRQKAESLVEEIKTYNHIGAIALRLNLRDRSSFGEFEAQVREHLQTVCQRQTFDYLVNNGGVGGGMAYDEIDEEYFDGIFDTNFKGPFFLTQRLVRYMGDGGRIVNTSSGSSRMASLGYSAYGPSKAALTSWTRYLAKELATRGITVNAVSPGPVRTNIAGGSFEKHPEYIQPLADQTALGRIGEAEDVAQVIVGLLSDEFAWVTAQDIDVSGGFML
jgi:NAD(P)-dependent dehydrogenase (short-subunit alcohol dehydrogenase family)